MQARNLNTSSVTCSGGWSGLATCGGCCCPVRARGGTRGTGRVVAGSGRVAGDLRMLQMHSDAGCTALRREVDFGCAEQILVVWAMLWLSSVVLMLVVIVGG